MSDLISKLEQLADRVEALDTDLRLGCTIHAAAARARCIATDLRAEIATERLAVERLAVVVEEHLGECPESAKMWADCPAIDDADKCINNCAVCWASWARSKEALDAD